MQDEVYFLIRTFMQELQPLTIDTIFSSKDQDIEMEICDKPIPGSLLAIRSTAVGKKNPH